MKREDLLQVYDADYAKTYNERFLTNPFSQLSTDFELENLGKIINKDTQWLDIGCGTGYFLSRFPGIKRAGLDINPVMLEHARKQNPDALFFQEGDFRNSYEEWNERWSLVSCMWLPYTYLDSLGEVEQVLSNMVNWTKPGGTIFIPVMDIEDFRPNLTVPYEENTEIFGGSILLTSYTWDWIENSGAIHRNMVAPHAEHFIRVLQPFFDTIELLRYPPYQAGWVSRKAILAKGRREKPDYERPANIIRHQVPAAPGESLNQKKTKNSAAQALSNRELFSEVFHRVSSGKIWKAMRKRLFK